MIVDKLKYMYVCMLKCRENYKLDTQTKFEKGLLKLRRESLFS